MPSIQAAHVINGSYNLSAKVNYESIDQLKEIISITRVIDGVNICEVELF